MVGKARDRFEALYVVAVFTGMRPGEMLALRSLSPSRPQPIADYGACSVSALLHSIVSEILGWQDAWTVVLIVDKKGSYALRTSRYQAFGLRDYLGHTLLLAVTRLIVFISH